MSEQTIAMIAAGIGVLATLVSWVFYVVVGKSLWDIRKLFKGTPGDGKGRTDRKHTEEPHPEQRP